MPYITLAVGLSCKLGIGDVRFVPAHESLNARHSRTLLTCSGAPIAKVEQLDCHYQIEVKHGRYHGLIQSQVQLFAPNEPSPADGPI